MNDKELIAHIAKMLTVDETDEVNGLYYEGTPELNYKDEYDKIIKLCREHGVA